MKFKPGDRVRCIDPISRAHYIYNLSYNSIYVVSSVHYDDRGLKFKTGDIIYSANRFIKVNTNNINNKLIKISYEGLI